MVGEWPYQVVGHQADPRRKGIVWALHNVYTWCMGYVGWMREIEMKFENKVIAITCAGGIIIFPLAISVAT